LKEKSTVRKKQEKDSNFQRDDLLYIIYLVI
jgi:hypothetical protein